MVSKKTDIPAATASDETYGFKTFPPSCVPAEGTVMVGRFIQVTRGPEVEVSPGQVITPPVVEFEAISGERVNLRNGAVEPLEPGASYSFWLLASVPLREFKDAKPAPGEMFAVRDNGMRTKKGMTPDQDHSQYHDISVGFPERPAPDRAISWDEV